MPLTALLDVPFYEGGAVSALVPSRFPVAIAGRPYEIDTQPETFYVRWLTETIPLIRQQADQSTAPAEQTLNPAGLWRRSQDSWHHGAGQVYRDRDTNADAYRFRTSKGVNVWTPYQISLLPDTASKYSSANTNLQLVVAGARIYLTSGTDIVYTTNIATASPTWSAVGVYAGSAPVSMTSDGHTIYLTDGSNVYTSPNTGSTFTAVNTLDCTLLAYTKSRLMAANANVIYNITVIGTPPAALFTHPNSDFAWVGFAEGVNNIFAAGYSGDKSIIYKTQIKADGTALDIPTVAGTLPSGEIVRSIKGYLGFVFIGTDKGWRFAEEDTNGNLTIGALVTTTSAVRCFEPQANYMWYGLTNYDSTSTGMGCANIQIFTEPLIPAYATDLMATAQGNVISLATFQNLRVMAISGVGVYAETTDLVTSATVDSGLIGFGLPDPKTSVFLHTDTAPLVGSYAMSLADNSGEFVTVGTTTTANDVSENFPTNRASTERFEVRVVLTRDAVTTTGPTFLRWTLKVIPTVADGPAEIFHIPLLLYPVVGDGEDYPVDVQFERSIISGLRASRQIVIFQEFNTSYTGFITDFKWYPYGLVLLADGTKSVRGTLLVDFQRIV